MPGDGIRDHDAIRLLSSTTKREREREKRASWAVVTEHQVPPTTTTRFVTRSTAIPLPPSRCCMALLFRCLWAPLMDVLDRLTTTRHCSSGPDQDHPSMAPRVVDRIREKLSRRRHSFTGSLKSAKSTASSVKSGQHGPEHGQQQHDDDDDNEAKQSRSVTPSQQLPASSQLHDDHDHDQYQDLGLTSSSSSASSTTTTTRTSHDHGDEKLQHQHQQQLQLLLQRRTSDGRDEGHESAPPRQQTQAQTQISEEKTKPDGGEGPGDGGAARDEEGKDSSSSSSSSQEGPSAAAAPLNSVQGRSLTGSIVTAASTGESAAESATGPAPAQPATTESATEPAAAPAVVPVVAAGAPASSDPPNRHQPVAASLLNSPPPVSTLSSSSSYSSSSHSAPLAALHPNFALNLTLASAQKPIPPPLPRQNSWQYRRAATPLQSIDEDSDPPSPTTVTSPKIAIADTSAAAADSSDDDSSRSSSSSDGGGGADDDSSDEDGDTIRKRLQKVEEDRDKHKAAARAAAAAAAAASASPIPCPRSRHANNKQLSVTAPESSSPARAPHPPPTRTDPLQVPSGLAAPDSAAAARKQSIFQNLHSHWARGYFDEEDDTASTIPATELELALAMTTRKIWVKRPNASPTLVTIKEDDLVDDVRDTILTKYGNSLGKTFDSPDLTLRIVPRDQASQKERLLGPEEPMCRTLDTYFPNGQDVSEALLIDTPRRHPKPSPRAHALYPDSMQPPENGEGYFPPVAMGGMPSPHRQIVLQAPPAAAPTHSIAVLNTGHIPNVPSPGGTRPRYNREQTNRPKLNRTHTSSPTIVGGGHPSGPKSTSSDPSSHRPSHSRAQSNSSDHKPAVGPPLPGSPVAANPQQARVATPPPPRVASPRSSTTKVRKAKKLIAAAEPLQPNMLNGTVPPISVLIVEDNPINLKLLEAFVKKLKVRWSTAMNGRDAVTKWRTGGFHLVLMDIQLPVMNGLDATREIRRLERVNSIGVFTSSPNGLPGSGSDDSELRDQDRLADMSLFKSPVIIVALTASSLQSDRHEALAAGCNDFLTKVCCH